MIDPTLYGLLSQIENDEIALPAMQRPFVWKEDRIYRLIDSLLRGFPIGATMLWRTQTIQRYRKISRDIDSGVSQIYTYETSESGSNRYLVLDGQQRLTSLYVAFKGSYDHKKLYIDTLSGDPLGKDPGNEYFDCRFLSDKEALELNTFPENGKCYFIPINQIIKIDPVNAATDAHKKATEIGLTDRQSKLISNVFIRCATILGNSKSLQVITVDEDPSHHTPIEEILEIFVRVNSGGLVLLKSDLLMSLLDLKWNDIQPELLNLVREINVSRPYGFTRDDVLKTLLLAAGAETRFDKLVADRKKVESLAQHLPDHLEDIKRAWLLLGCILLDDCKITSERFFRGGHNSILPFVLFLSKNKSIPNEERRKIALGIYVAIMSGIFSGAEARMGGFTKNIVANAKSFPLNTDFRRVITVT